MKEQPLYTEERRSGKDRRSKRFGNLWWLLKTGHRRQIRRAADRRGIAELDHFPADLRLAAILVLLLSVVDGVLTLLLVENGATELNPVMAYYLDRGPHIFMITKYLLTAAVVVIAVLLNHAFLRLLKVRLGQLLKVFAGCFAMVVAWELFLMTQIGL